MIVFSYGDAGGPELSLTKWGLRVRFPSSPQEKVIIHQLDIDSKTE